MPLSDPGRATRFLRNPHGESGIQCPSCRLLRCSCRPPFGNELALERPRVLARVERFASPVKRIRSDLREGPPCLCPVGTDALLKNVPAVPAADLLFAMTADRVGPFDAPRVD